MGHSKYRVTPFYTCGFQNKLGLRITPWPMNNSARGIFVLPVRPDERLDNGPISWGATSVLAFGDCCFPGWVIVLCEVQKAVTEHHNFCWWSVGRPRALVLRGTPAAGRDPRASLRVGGAEGRVVGLYYWNSPSSDTGTLSLVRERAVGGQKVPFEQLLLLGTCAPCQFPLRGWRK